MASKQEEISNYSVVRRIGAGRFGEVFQVRHKKTGDLYCWKVVAYKGLSEKEKEQLVMEVNVMRQLKHPNIVRYVDRIIDKKKQLLYILMEYCDAGDLAENMRQCHKHYQIVNEQVIFDIALQLIFALAYCHNCKLGSKDGKVLHRDLKPQNIFLSTNYKDTLKKSYTFKIGDFGLCRHIGTCSFAHSCVGTPYYWCPELLLSNNKNYDDKMDMWALGCVLYELSAGKTPFHYTTTLAELTQEMRQGVPLPLSYRSDKLNSLLYALLQKDPNNRASAMQCLGYSFWKKPTMELFLNTLNYNDKLKMCQNIDFKEEKIDDETPQNIDISHKIKRPTSRSLTLITPNNKRTNDWYTLLLNAGKEATKHEDVPKSQNVRTNRYVETTKIPRNNILICKNEIIKRDNRNCTHCIDGTLNNYDINENEITRWKHGSEPTRVKGLKSTMRNVTYISRRNTDGNVNRKPMKYDNIITNELSKQYMQRQRTLVSVNNIQDYGISSKRYDRSEIDGQGSTPVNSFLDNALNTRDEQSSFEARFTKADHSDTSDDSITTKLEDYDSLYLGNCNKRTIKGFDLNVRNFI
ncbi:protein kinase domain containing protein [Theileria equi strain WA]|uniref:non-specific serine/threonine protein kinase n=1 Tax=Theileria equi strain WA TaxID=1537102 RepID=L0ATQ0_THEEQ|nr:protein kinase domain containing protein [Theileria equi strain WA]AFZ79022.1 protein kinase domain containing protein [Theileria equi strain WA]|eukprot:XP_004828688.1 protein kinase domain containing protein [Theileria equi strain WA]